MPKSFFRLLTPVGLVLLFVSMAHGAMYERRVPARDKVLQMQTPAPTGRIVIKFSDESKVLVSESGLVGTKSAEIQRLAALLVDPDFRGGIQRRFPAAMQTIDAERRVGEDRVKHALPNLNRYGVLDLRDRADDSAHLLMVLKKILADPAVETAFLEPKAVPAALGFDAFTGSYSPPKDTGSNPAGAPLQTLPAAGVRSDTPDYSPNQGYLGAAPEGVNAWAVAEVPGALGAGLHIVDIEGAWLWAHEDLATPFFNPGGMYSDLGWRNHGTAVLGEISGNDNGFGVRGITPNVSIGGISIHSNSTSGAINAAWRAVEPGDAVVIELHAPGPNATGEGQMGYVPMEYWQDNFDAIQIAAANGRIVCEAAGNGSQDLDSATYGSLFDRDFRDSGAILCGAATRFGVPEWFTNYSQRVDLNGWGSSVTSCAYGDLQGIPGFPETEYYTAQFSGTSSATPIVTGAVLALQGIVKEGSGSILDPLLMREILVQTGSPASGTKHIGPRPDILAAWTETAVGFGTLAGSIIDAQSGLPVAGAVLEVQDSNFKFITDETGAFSLSFPAGPIVLEISSFFHDSQGENSEILAGETVNLEISLNPLPTVSVVGHISSQVGGDLTGLRATILDAPLNPGEISPDGEFSIDGAPAGRPFRVLVDNVPYHGADLVPVLPVSDPRGQNDLNIQLAQVTSDFEYFSGNFVDNSEVWTWGIPVSGPVAGFSGQRCWGVGMAGEGYPNNTIASLVSNPRNLWGQSQVLLSFHYWCETEAGIDGVKLQIKSSGNWIDLSPETDYDYQQVPSLNGVPGWSGNSGGWHGAVFNLLPYTDEYIIFRFLFGADSTLNDGGFYVDDITFDFGDVVSSVAMQPEIATAFAPRVSVHPNPFNPQTRISWEISQPGPLEVVVYDARGLVVRRLFKGVVSEAKGTLLFDGRGDQGNVLASGIYLVRVLDGVGRDHVSRVSLVK